MVERRVLKRLIKDSPRGELQDGVPKAIRQVSRTRKQANVHAEPPPATVTKTTQPKQEECTERAFAMRRETERREIRGCELEVVGVRRFELGPPSRSDLHLSRHFRVSSVHLPTASRCRAAIRLAAAQRTGRPPENPLPDTGSLVLKRGTIASRHVRTTMNLFEG